MGLLEDLVNGIFGNHQPQRIPQQQHAPAQMRPAMQMNQAQQMGPIQGPISPIQGVSDPMYQVRNGYTPYSLGNGPQTFYIDTRNRNISQF